LITKNFSPLLPFSPPKTKKVFLSYSHQNVFWLNRLRTHLAGLRRAKQIESWDDKEILPGQLWDYQIKKKLEEADIFILLLSADFIASDYIWNNELSVAIQRFRDKNATVIPILFEPLDLAGIPSIFPINDFKAFRIGDFEIIPKMIMNRYKQ
jgi:internalin A